MSEADPSFEELLQFRSLLQSGDKLAVATNDQYTSTKRQDLFHRGIKETLAKAAARGDAALSRTSAKNVVAADSAKSGQTKSPILCFAFRETGVCSNDRCRFSHDAAALVKAGGTPSAAPAAPKETSIGKLPIVLRSLSCVGRGSDFCICS